MRNEIRTPDGGDHRRHLEGKLPVGQSLGGGIGNDYLTVEATRPFAGHREDRRGLREHRGYRGASRCG